MSYTPDETYVYNIVSKKCPGLVTGNKKLTLEVLYLYIQEVEQVIINYCRIVRVPVQLRYVWANMVIDAANFQAERDYVPSGDGDKDKGITIDGVAKAIKVGDTTVEMSVDSTKVESNILNSHKPNLDEVLLNYKAQLNQFRRLL